MESGKGMSDGERKSRSPKWSDEETKALVRFRAHFEPLFSGAHRNKIEGWQQIALSLRENGLMSACERTARMCETKWANLTHSYQKAKLSGEAIEGPLRDVDWFYHNRHNVVTQDECEECDECEGDDECDECESEGDEDDECEDRYITIRHGFMSKRFRIDASAESIVDSIVCVFGLPYFPELHEFSIFLADTHGNLHSIDRNLSAYETYTFYIAAVSPL